VIALYFSRNAGAAFWDLSNHLFKSTGFDGQLVFTTKRSGPSNGVFSPQTAQVIYIFPMSGLWAGFFYGGLMENCARPSPAEAPVKSSSIRMIAPDFGETRDEGPGQGGGKVIKLRDGILRRTLHFLRSWLKIAQRHSGVENVGRSGRTAGSKPLPDAFPPHPCPLRWSSVPKCPSKSCLFFPPTIDRDRAKESNLPDQAHAANAEADEVRWISLARNELRAFFSREESSPRVGIRWRRQLFSFAPEAGCAACAFDLGFPSRFYAFFSQRDQPPSALINAQPPAEHDRPSAAVMIGKRKARQRSGLDRPAKAPHSHLALAARFGLALRRQLAKQPAAGN